MPETLADIDLGDLQAEIRRIASEQPDYIYEGPDDRCVYVERDDDKLIGSCLVGCALVNLGVEPEILVFDQAIGGAPEIDLFLERHGHHGQLVAWIRNAQYSQDNGETWGAAVAIADIECGDTR